MTQTLTQNQTVQLRECLALAQDPNRHLEAKQNFSHLLDEVQADQEVTELIETLWNEVLKARCSAMFWQQISDVEKQMTERLAENHLQLKQNYLRLMQEQ